MLAGCVRSVPSGSILPSCCVCGRSGRHNAVPSAIASLAPSSGSLVSIGAMVGPRSRSRRATCNLFTWNSGCGESEDEDRDYLEASLLLEGVGNGSFGPEPIAYAALARASCCEGPPSESS